MPRAQASIWGYPYFLHILFQGCNKFCVPFTLGACCSCIRSAFLPPGQLPCHHNTAPSLLSTDIMRFPSWTQQQHFLLLLDLV